MLLSELYAKLSYGELSNLALANESDGTILEAAQPRIVNYANDALRRMYSRFVIKSADVLVMQTEYIVHYHLKPKFAVNYTPLGDSDDEPIRYIHDLAYRPFLGDVIKILSVVDQYGFPLPLNDDEHPSSLFTPQPTTLQVPCPVSDEALSVVYQAAHPVLVGDLDESIEIPDILLEAFTAYIAYKAFSHMNTADSTAKAQEHLAIYTALCAETDSKDLVNTSVSFTNSRFHQRGFI